MMTQADIDAVADAVADRLRGNLPQLLTVEQVAERLAVSRDWVYANQQRLGAIRLGAGSKPRLRFDQTVIAKYVAASATACTAGNASTPAQTAPVSAPRRGRPRRYPPLAPIRAQAAPNTDQIGDVR